MKGIPVSTGIATGKAIVIHQKSMQIPHRNIADADIEGEIQRFTEGIVQAKRQIAEIQKATLDKLDGDKAGIFNAHLLMLEDPEFLNLVESTIRREKLNAEYALETALDFYITALQAVEDPYLRERSVDLKDVGARLLRIMLREKSFPVFDIREKCVVVAGDLTPSETAQMDPKYIMGFITELGGPTSHTAIMAKALDIPAVVGCQNATSQIHTGDQVIIDGQTGEVWINPEPSVRNEYQNKESVWKSQKQDWLQLKNLPPVSADGRQIVLAANIGHAKDIPLALENGADGVGLFRTEFLFMDKNSLPTEEEQYQTYRKVLADMNGKPVIIRTLDIGGDKKLDYLPFSEELNPFLGYRALRLCLDRPDIFKTQLRAILRASTAGNLKVMFPMVSGMEELQKAKQIANEVQKELTLEGKPLHPAIEWGIMIEIPSAAMISDILAKEADFFSLGTNDLIQYTLAVDRTNEKVASLYEPFHPAILRLIKIVADNAHGAGKWVGMCGEMASDIRLLPVLTGLGLDELSVAPSAVLKIKKAFRSLDFQNCKAIAERALQLETAAEVRNYLENISSKELLSK